MKIQSPIFLLLAAACSVIVQADAQTLTERTPVNDHGLPVIQNGEHLNYTRQQLDSLEKLRHETGGTTDDANAAIGAQCPAIWSDMVFGTCLGENNSLTPYDLDGDGTMELIVNSNLGIFGIRGYWYILKYDATTGEYGMAYTSPIHENTLDKLRVVDTNGDSGLELLYVESGKLYVFSLLTMAMDTVLQLPGVSSFGSVNQIRFGDGDNDGAAEIVVGLDDRILLIDPLDYSIEHDIDLEAGDFALGNVDSDNTIEIAFSHGSTIELVNSIVTYEYDFRPSQSTADGFIELADIDNDGRLEAIVAEFWYIISVYNVELEQPIYTIDTDNGVDALLVQNISGSAIPEILYGDDQWGSIHCHNATNGGPLWSIPNPDHGTTGIAVADFDQDGQSEVVWGAGCSSTGADYLHFHQVADQAFEWQSLHIDGPYHTIQTGDVDGDSEMEIVAISFESDNGYDSGILTIYDAMTKAIEFRSNGTLLGNAWTGIHAMELTDHGNDGDMDIVVATGDPYSGKFWVIDGNTYLVEAEYEYPNQDDIDEFYSLAIHDLDNDGSNEYIAASSDKICVINSETFAVEWSSTGLTSSPNPNRILVGNIDSDPEVEIVMCKGRIYTYDNATYQQSQSAATNFTAVHLLDWDGQAPSEIIAGNSLGQIKIIDGATLTEIQSFQVSTVAINAITAFNIDGLDEEELIITSGDKLYFMKLDGTVVQSAAIEPRLGMYDGLEVSDYDNNGEPNIIVGAARGLFELNPACGGCLWFGASVDVTDDFMGSQEPDGAIEITVLGGTPPFIFQWENGGSTPDLENLAQGDYPFTVIDAVGCSLDSIATVNSLVTTIQELGPADLILGPNPAENELWVSNLVADDVIVIIDAIGHSVDLKWSLNGRSNTQASLNIESLASGVYLISVTSQNRNRTLKFVKL